MGWEDIGLFVVEMIDFVVLFWYKAYVVEDEIDIMMFINK